MNWQSSNEQSAIQENQSRKHERTKTRKKKGLYESLALFVLSGFRAFVITASDFEFARGGLVVVIGWVPPSCVSEEMGLWTSNRRICLNHG
jgi:hypothetical protein